MTNWESRRRPHSVIDEHQELLTFALPLRCDNPLPYPLPPQVSGFQVCCDFQMDLLRSTFGRRSWSAVLLLIVSFLSLIDLTLTEDDLWIQTTNSAGETIYLRDDRKPALYTQNFGDCLGSSLINVTRFDAAYYQDNMTVLFHLEGNTNVANESIMSMFLHRLDRWAVTDPCSVHWRFCIRRVSLRPHLQSLQCPDIQVRRLRMPCSLYH